jgi:2-keto-3-deoxy-L-rhamnonate aldolase RhmA
LTSTAAPMLRNPLADRLRSGGVGTVMIVKQAHTVDIAVAAASCDYDAISIDLEHSVIPESAAAQICVAALGAGITPLVRVPSHDAHYANRLLDAGALGIVAPHVESAEEARAIVAACRFAPLGRRSLAGSWPHFGYRAVPTDDALRMLDAATLVVVMLETPEAVERADEIAAVDGVDILHIGGTDLCSALGIPGQYTHPALRRCYERTIDACRANGKFAGAGGLGSSPDVMRAVVQRGARYVTAGNDWAFMMEAARQRATMLRQMPLHGNEREK